MTVIGEEPRLVVSKHFFHNNAVLPRQYQLFTLIANRSKYIRSIFR